MLEHRPVSSPNRKQTPRSPTGLRRASPWLLRRGSRRRIRRQGQRRSVLQDVHNQTVHALRGENVFVSIGLADDLGVVKCLKRSTHVVERRIGLAREGVRRTRSVEQMDDDAQMRRIRKGIEKVLGLLQRRRTWKRGRQRRRIILRAIHKKRDGVCVETDIAPSLHRSTRGSRRVVHTTEKPRVGTRSHVPDDRAERLFPRLGNGASSPTLSVR